MPLVLLLFVMRHIVSRAHQEKLIWIGIVVALLEPAYQMVDMDAKGTYPLWAVVLVGLQVYAINVFELIVFKRYDFIAMYLFRLVFYSIWHIGWRYIRLQLLF